MVIKMKNDVLTKFSVDSPDWLNNFISIYQQLSINNLELLSNIYHQDVTFVDPIHKVEGFDNLYDYFKRLYLNLASCDFVIEDVIEQGTYAAIYWKMTYTHKKLNQGKPVTVFGHSHLKARDDKVIYHRDYLDLGVMIYEQLPLIGRVIRWIKSQAAK
jgi:ketosteroid isomerase-like protein